MRMGAPDGLTLRYVGLEGMVGSVERAALMAACTSRAAPLMSREASNCMITCADPRELLEVISLTPAMCPSARSRGVATVAAMDSGPAPGRFAFTKMTGKSISGRGAMGRRRKATAPARARAMVSRVVATGLRMKMEEGLAGSTSGPKRLGLTDLISASSPPSVPSSGSVQSCRAALFWSCGGTPR